MPKLSISQLASFTGKDRRTVTGRLDGLDYVEGEDNAHLYDAQDALEAIYCPAQGESMSLEQARTELAIEQAELTRVRKEEAKKTRIPIEIVTDIWDAALQSFAATLKATRGKTLDAARINDLLAILRTAELPRKW